MNDKNKMTIDELIAYYKRNAEKHEYDNGAARALEIDAKPIIAAQAVTIAQLREENKDLRARVSCYSAFSGSIYKCKSCDGYYMSGYICACGRDNTYSDKEWNSARALKGGE